MRKLSLCLEYPTEWLEKLANRTIAPKLQRQKHLLKEQGDAREASEETKIVS